MKVAELDFAFPEELIATSPVHPPRVMRVENGKPTEITFAQLIDSIPAKDLLVVNDTRVLRRRVFGGPSRDLEILFLSQPEPRKWKVLFPSRVFKVGDVIELPFGSMKLVQKGRPQIVELDRDLDEADFERAGELPLPPYIQKARSERHTRDADDRWYQTAWADKPGSFAAPTASLHFTDADMERLRERGVAIARVTLHVGLGTFLPVTTDDLDQHEMHFEWAQIPVETAREIQRVRAAGGRVWSLGTTVTRTLESAASGKLAGSWEQGFEGETNLLIQPGSEWRVIDRLLTNFHQPRSTLLALVAGFAGLETVRACYDWAIERKFRLFSYGDFSLWMR